jgi:adenine phosphoribosyltransferase
VVTPTSNTGPSRTELRSRIRDVPDFPEPGIVFKDITPLFTDVGTLREAVRGLASVAGPTAPAYVIGAEARGFLLGPALALELDAGFALARRPGKLPRRTVATDYALEYGANRLELHTDAFPPGARVLVHDDLLATGGTAHALCRLVEQVGGTVVGCVFLIELAGLGGRERLRGHEVHCLLRYD